MFLDNQASLVLEGRRAIPPSDQTRMTKEFEQEAYVKTMQDYHKALQESRKFNEARAAKAVEMYEAGQSMQDIADYLNVSVGTVQTALRKAKVKTRPKGRPGLTEEKKDQIRYMIQIEGRPVKVVAHVLGVSIQTVYKQLKEMGLSTTNSPVRQLTHDEVREIRGKYLSVGKGQQAAPGTSILDLAEEYGVTGQTIWKVVTHQTYPGVLPSQRQIDMIARLRAEAIAAGVQMPEEIPGDKSYVWRTE